MVEDDPIYLEELQSEVISALSTRVEARFATDAASARETAERFRPDLILLDMVFPLVAGGPPIQDAGARTIDSLRQLLGEPTIIALSGQDRDFAVRLLTQQRIQDFLFKDLDWEEIRMRILSHLDSLLSDRRRAILVDELSREKGDFEPVFVDPSMMKVMKSLDAVTATETTVMLRGESGTGKEVLARRLHDRGPRRDSAFIAINCGALDEGLVMSELFGHTRGAFTGSHQDRAGKFELAHGGTLFLDEVGELSPANQVRLLRVLETRTIERVGGSKPIECDVRLITATHRNLEEMVESGTFREDLFFRIHVFPVHIPPLRDRPGDLEPLSLKFLTHHAFRMGKRIDEISPAALLILQAYRWPGNVRQLRNVLEHAAILEPTRVLMAENLPPLPGIHRRDEGVKVERSPGVHEPGLIIPENAGYLEAMTAYERSLLDAALKRHHGDTVGVAAQLDIPLRTLQRRIKTLGIQSREYRS